jgi:hypothetical protein
VFSLIGIYHFISFNKFFIVIAVFQPDTLWAERDVIQK